ncbi:methyltransferase [Colletotrichum tabaci]|uniref:Methyltransferase n=1 Tax=Colletotrichum tabaci TaxID=1209068 RepID=A0AAV9TLF4_9PEZI
MADLFAASAANVAAGAPPAGGPPHPPPPDLLGPIEIEDEGIDTDEPIVTDGQIANYTVSLSSSVVNYPMEYGRRYHAFRPGAYKFPNDDFELDRLDLAHAMMVKAIGNRLYRAPVRLEQAHRILDIGTGTGIWAIAMGDIYTNAEITGIDLSAIQPQWVPYNVRFEVDDIESPWIEGRKYDFIMCRYMVASIKDWPGLVDNIYDHLNPGGWVEFQDVTTKFYSVDGTFTNEHATARWMDSFSAACLAMGRDTTVAPRLGAMLEDAGFENTHSECIKTPLGPWARGGHFRELGMMNLVLTLDGLEALSLKLFSELLKRTETEIMAELAAVRNELTTCSGGAFHAMFDIYVVYGQKPLTAESESESEFEG